MKTLLCLFVFIFINFVCSVQSIHALCGNPITRMSDIGQTSSSVYGYSKTKINPCGAFYYDLPKVESTMTEQYGATVTTVSQGQHQSYAASYPAQFDHNYGNPVPGRIYTITGVHFVSAFYYGYESGSGWYDPYQVGNFESGNGGWEEYPDPYFGYVTYWYNIPIYLDTTYASLVYQSNSPPPIDPITGCATGYTSLGGWITSEPTAGVINNNVVVFGRGGGNGLFYQYSSGGSFSGWIPLGGATFQAPMSTVINGVLYLEVIGTDNNPYFNASTDGVNFSGWVQGTVGAEIAPSVDFNGFIYDFSKGESVAQPALCFMPTPVTTSSLSTVVFEPINSPLDQNPKYGNYPLTDGLRIFPDKTLPNDPIDRTKVRVKATVFPAQAGRKIYFKTYDMDDPSFDAAPVDGNGATGNDNRGKVGTTDAGQAGKMNCPVGTNLTLPATCSTTSVNLGYAKTDPNGVAVMELEVTKQPGDNFAVAISQASNYLNNTKPIGADLRNGAQNVPVGVGTFFTPSNAAVRTQMLTVWRKLHLEVDRMASVPSTGTNERNSVTGFFPTNLTIPANSYLPVNVNVSPALEIDRFENGRLETNGQSFEVFQNGTNTVSIINPAQINISAGQQFILYDDDDFNSDDGTALRPKHGDEGEDIPFLNDDFLKESDVPTLNLNTPASNVLAYAFIRPTYDLTGSGEDVPFVLNVPDTQSATLFNQNNFDNLPYEADEDFWTVYLLSAYQPGTNRDRDPLGEISIPNNPPWNGVSDCQRCTGSLVFLEMHSTHECPPSPNPIAMIECSIGATKVHEIGHLLNADHSQDGVMDSLDIKFSPTSLDLIRFNKHP